MAAISRDFVTKNGVIIEGDSAVTSSTNQIDALQVAGGAAIAKNLIVGTTATILGATTLNSSLTVNGQTNLNGAVVPASGVSLGSLSNPFKDLFLTGNSLYVGNVILSSSGTTATLSVTTGSVKLIVGSSQITDNTNSTSTTTGSLVVAGGVGIAKNLYVGGVLNVVSSSTLQGPATLSSTLSVQGLSSFNDTTPATSAGAGSVKIAGGLRVNDNAVVMSAAANTGTLESNALYVEGGVGIKNGLAVSGTAVFKQDVYFQGATTYVYSTNTVYTDNILDLHIPLTGVDGTWLADDGKDIGFRFNYYSGGTDKNALLLLSNNSKKLEFFSESTEVNGVISNTVYGEFKTGSIQVANSTSNNGNTNTGALTVVGGVGIGKDLRVGGTITATNISIGGTVNALGVVYQDATGKLVSQSNITYSVSGQKLVGTITRADNLTGGTTGSIPIQTNNGITTFITPGNRGQVLIWDNLTDTPTWGAVIDSSAGNATTSTNLAGGAAGNIPYQSTSGFTTFLANGADGSILTFNTATLAPQWNSPDTLTVGFANTATRALLADTATIALLANSANTALLANTSTFALLADTATTSLLANTATFALLADTATFALLADTATFALLANTATLALLANTASYALLAETSTRALLADTATYALLAETSTYSLLANTATFALLADTATLALLANTATYALLAGTSTYSLLANTATFALLANTATHALSADFATSATYAFTATYAEIGGQSSFAQNLSNGSEGQIPYQVSSSTTAFFGPGDVGQILVSAGTTSTGPVFTNTSSIQVGYSANIIGGSTGSIVYQISPDTTGMLDVASTAGSLLVSNGTVPQYVSQVQAIVNGSDNSTTSSGQTLVVTSGGLGVNGDSYFAGNLGIGKALYISGDLYVDGTQFMVDSQTIATGDKTITLSTGSGTPLQAAGSGIQVGDTSTPYASLLYNGYSHWETGGSNDIGIRITSIEETYSANSGALQIAGGVGVSGNIFVNGDVTATTFFGNLTGVATTASYAFEATTASYALLAETATHALLADTATYAITANFATSATYAFTATYAAFGGASEFASYATTATNIANGSTGSLVIQSSPGKTSFVEIGTSTYILTSNGLSPEWTSLSNLSAGNIAFADNIKNGTDGQLVYQASSSTTRFAGPGNVGDILISDGTNGPVYTSTTNVYVGRALLADTATYALIAETSTYALLAETSTYALVANTATYAINVLGGNEGSLVYQSATSTTALLAGGSANSILTYVNNVPTWVTTATLSGGIASSSTVNSQSLKVTSGGIGITGESYFANNVSFGGSINIANTSYVNGSKILIAQDLDTVTTTATYITNDPTLVSVSGTSTAYGTYNFGSVSDIWTFNDYNTGTNTGFYSINDASGAPGYIVYAGFSNITDFNRVVLNINYTQNSGHTVTVDLYNHQTLSWDSLTSYSGSVGWYQLALAIIDSAPYISSGNVTLRIYHVSTGSPSHRTWIDYIALENSVQGGQGPRGATGAQGAQGVQGLTTTTTSTFIFSNTTESSNTITGAVTVSGGVGIGKNLNVGGELNARNTFRSYGPATFSDTVTFTGTATYVLTTNTVYTDALIELHRASTGSWTSNDGQDIGILGHYYDTVTSSAKDFFLGFAVDERYLEFLVNGYENTPGNFTGDFGDLKLNKILLTSTETSTSSVTGALVVPGGVGIAGNINVQSSGQLTVGIELQPSVLPNTPINTVGDVNSYLQINNQNINSGTYASSDFVLTADDGDDTNYYVDLGIANSNFSYPDFNISAPHDGYLYVQGGNLNVATGSPGKTIEFWVGGTATTSTGLTLPGTTVGKRALSITNSIVRVSHTTTATSTNSGALQVIGGVGIGGNLYVASDSYVNGSLIITTATIGQYASQYSILAGTDTVITTSTGATTISNNSTLQSVTGRGATTNNAISITSATSSVSTTSGALIVTGGVGIGNNLYVGGNMYAGGNITATTFIGNLTGTATLALNANTATLALNANTATLALNANTATLALNANTATLALNANTATFARSATSSTNIIGGAAGSLVYQLSTGSTTFLSIGINGYILTSNGSAPTWAAISGLSAGNATTATNLAGGLGGSVPYQSSAGTTAMLGIATTAGYVLSSTGSIPQWASLSSLGAGSATTATNIAGGTAGQLVYQVSPGISGFAGPGIAGTVLVSNGTAAPTYQNTLTLAGTTVAINTTTGALRVAGGVGVGGSVYTGNRVGFVNAAGASVVYQFYNAATNSLDTVFG